MLRSVAVAVFLMAAVSCGEPAQVARPLPVLRICPLPDQSSERLRQRYEPLCAYLTERLGVPTELVLVADYDEALEAICDGRADLSLLGGLTYVRVREESDARPLVMREVDLNFTSVFLVAASNERHSIEDFAGARFGFGPELSTSGHLMPRLFLEERGLVPEQAFASVTYTSGHDDTCARVASGELDLGVANALIVRRLKAGELPAQGVRIIDETPPYPNYCWVARSGLNEDCLDEIVDAFLALSRADPDGARVLNLLDARGYLPARAQDYAKIEEALRLLNEAGG